jgi:hypothetical protein
MIERRFKAHPLSAPGEFYVVNDECMACGAPHAVAPGVIGWADDSQLHCIWKKQPESPAELEQACAAFDASCLACYRYAGEDQSIMQRLGPEYCDHFPRSTPWWPPAVKEPVLIPLAAPRSDRVRRLIVSLLILAGAVLVLWLLTWHESV